MNNNNLFSMLPNEITDKIKSFIPRDRDMKSPISDLINHISQYDNYYDGYDYDSDEEVYSLRHFFKSKQRRILYNIHKKDCVDIVINYVMTLPYETMINNYKLITCGSWREQEEVYMRHKNCIFFYYDSVLDDDDQISVFFPM